jgi:hypothetical protein
VFPDQDQDGIFQRIGKLFLDGLDKEVKQKLSPVIFQCIKNSGVNYSPQEQKDSF